MTLQGNMLHDDPTKSDPPWRDNLSPYNCPPRHGERPSRKKVALVGFEEKNHRTAPLNDPEWEIWGFNMGNRQGIHADEHGRFRADRWFDLHPREPQSELDMAWINQCPVPIYLPTIFTENPNARAYPLESVEGWLRKRFNTPPGYWASSFAYALALALMEGFETIGLFGINLDWGRERIYERGNLEYYIGLAQGFGREVMLPTTSKLLTHPARYGIEYEDEKQAVIAGCAEVVRQLMTQKQFDFVIVNELEDRIKTLEEAGRKIMIGVHNIMYRSREPWKLRDRQGLEP